MVERKALGKYGYIETVSAPENNTGGVLTRFGERPM
jgi:hypothetical protein